MFSPSEPIFKNSVIQEPFWGSHGCLVFFAHISFLYLYCVNLLGCLLQIEKRWERYCWPPPSFWLNFISNLDFSHCIICISNIGWFAVLFWYFSVWLFVADLATSFLYCISLNFWIVFLLLANIYFSDWLCVADVEEWVGEAGMLGHLFSIDKLYFSRFMNCISFIG